MINTCRHPSCITVLTKYNPDKYCFRHSRIKAITRAGFDLDNIIDENPYEYLKQIKRSAT